MTDNRELAEGLRIKANEVVKKSVVDISGKVQLASPIQNGFRR